MSDREVQRELDKIAAETQEWLDANGDVMVCDFCAHALDLATTVTFDTGMPIMGEMSALDDNLSTGSIDMVWSSQWAACADCAPVVRAGDPEKLAEHALRNRDVARVGPISAWLYVTVRADLIDLYTEFFRRRPKEVPNPEVA